METRKVQTNRNSTHSVSLPKPWADRLGIHRGSSLAMEMRADGSILVHPPGEPARKASEWRGETDASREEDVERLVLAAYVAGYETIHLSLGAHAKPEAVDAACRRVCGRVRGLVLVEEARDHVVMQDLLDPTDFNAAKGVHRMHLEARDMLFAATRGLTGEGPAASREAFDARDDELDRMLLIITKQHRRIAAEPAYAERAGMDARDSLHHLLVAQQLEGVGDEVVRLATEAQGALAPEARVDLSGATKLAIKALDDAVAAFYRKDARLAGETIRFASDVNRLARRIPLELVERADGAMGLACAACFRNTAVFDALGRIPLHAKGIAEVAIDRAVD